MINQIRKRIQERSNIVKSNISSFISEIDSEIIEKGKKLPEGTVRYHGNQKVVKRNNKWVPVSNKGKTFDDKVEDYYQYHAEKFDEYKEMVNDIAEQYGGSAVVAPLKDKRRVREKTVREYDGDYSKVKDILRSTIVLDSREQARDLVNQLTKTYPTKKAWVDFEKGGYRGGNVVIQMDGRKAEIQVNTPVNLALKDNELPHPAVERTREILRDAGVKPGQGHEYYERMRSLDDPWVQQSVTQEMVNYFDMGRKTLYNRGVQL